MRRAVFAVAALLASACAAPVAPVAPPPPPPERVPVPLYVEVDGERAGASDELVALSLRFTLTNRGAHPIVVPGTWFDVGGVETLSQELGKSAFADVAHSAWDYDATPRTRFTSHDRPVIATVGRILNDLPGGYRLQPGDDLDRTVVVQLPVRFNEAIVTAGAYSWYGDAPIVLCWKTLEDGSGLPLPWVLDESAGTTAAELDPDARVRACREYEKRAAERAGARPEREGGAPPASEDKMVPFLADTHPAIQAAHAPVVAYDRAEVSLWAVDD